MSVDGKSSLKDIDDLFKEHFFENSPLGPSQGRMNDLETNNKQIEPGYASKGETKVIKSISRGKLPTRA